MRSRLTCPRCDRPVYIDGASSEWAHESFMDGWRCFWRTLRDLVMSEGR